MARIKQTAIDPNYKSEEEALNMLQKEKTPKRSSAVIRKALAEKAAAEVKAKGGEVGKSFEKQLKRAREETPSVLNKIKKSTSASTPSASAGHQQMRIAGRLEKIGGSVCLDLVNPLSAAAGFTTPASGSCLAGSEAIIMTKAYRIQQLESDLEAAKQRATDAETAQKEAEEAQKKAAESAKKADEALKKAQTDLGNLQGVSEENTNLNTKVQKLEKEAAQAQINFAATLEAEKKPSSC
ncbi:uncharacterized protein LOC110698407 [Chenopodium quinoa]|uniref:uncharacterized protein LOC110698407 n=1 Tax=Chenopodium quinoa TaxID=63459 RepID=UPI000B781895|nr:uncharacterized protein LOC110698407 [Chenopodium quinoa]